MTRVTFECHDCKEMMSYTCVPDQIETIICGQCNAEHFMQICGSCMRIQEGLHIKPCTCVFFTDLDKYVQRVPARYKERSQFGAFSKLDRELSCVRNDVQELRTQLSELHNKLDSILHTLHHLPPVCGTVVRDTAIAWDQHANQ